MSLTRFTLFGLYEFMPDLFEGVKLPEGLDKQTLIDLLMERSGQLCPYHQSPSNFKNNITRWFDRNYENISRQVEAMQVKFSPIENYDRHEELVESPDITRRVEFDGNNTTVSNSNDKATGKVSAYNETTFTDSSQNIGEARNDTTTSFNSGNTEKETGTRTHINHIHGNIGVTQSTEMARSYRDFYSFDLYVNIAERFENEFLIRLY